MDQIERSAQHATDPPPEPTVVTAPDPGQPAPDPVFQARTEELDQRQKDMDKGFTQKMQTLAEDQRRFEVKESQFMELQKQQQANLAAGQTAANSPTRGLGEQLAVTNPALAENPAGQELFNQVGRQFDEKFSTLESSIAERDKSIAALAAENSAMKNDQLSRQYKIEHTELVSKYGQQAIDANAQGILDSVTREYNAGQAITLESALISAAPDVVRGHIAEQERVKAREEFADERGAGLQMEGIFGKPPADKYEQGEDFMTTAARHMTLEAKVDMARESLESD